jgi:DNA-directed RNA polymerase subunit A"
MVMKIFDDYKEKLPVSLIEEVKEGVPEGISEAKVKKILEEVYSEYISSLVNPGESVGIISAESIGEPSTQMTLNTKLLAGVSEMNVTLGIPRIIEILDGRKIIKTPMMEIGLNKKFSEKEIKKFARKIRDTLLKEFVVKVATDIGNNSLKLELNKDLLAEYDLTIEEIKTLVAKKYDVKIYGSSILVKVKDASIGDLHEIKGLILDLHTIGIKGVTQVLPVKKDNKHVIMTSGSNLKEVLKLDFVNPKNTKSNDLYETEKFFGIEAVRQLIIDEVLKVFENQGLDINERHIFLIADMMCYSGRIQGITRYGIVSEKKSVLARASFETPVKYLIAAALDGEVDELASVVENVMINQPIPVGTGLPGLVTKFKNKK